MLGVKRGTKIDLISFALVLIDPGSFPKQSNYRDGQNHRRAPLIASLYFAILLDNQYDPASFLLYHLYLYNLEVNTLLPKLFDYSKTPLYCQIPIKMGLQDTQFNADILIRLDN